MRWLMATLTQSAAETSNWETKHHTGRELENSGLLAQRSEELTLQALSPEQRGYRGGVNTPSSEPWTKGLQSFYTWARRSNQSILKEISPGISLEGMMLKLKLQYFGHLCEELTHWKRLRCWEGLGAGGKGDDRGWDGWMASPTPRTWVWVNSGRWWWTGRPGMLRFMRSQSQTWLSDWTELSNNSKYSKLVMYQELLWALYV